MCMMIWYRISTEVCSVSLGGDIVGVGGVGVLLGCVRYNSVVTLLNNSSRFKYGSGGLNVINVCEWWWCLFKNIYIFILYFIVFVSYIQIITTNSTFQKKKNKIIIGTVAQVYSIKYIEGKTILKRNRIMLNSAYDRVIEIGSHSRS